MDERFYRVRQGIRARALAGEIDIPHDDWPDVLLTGVAAADKVRAGELCFLEAGAIRKGRSVCVPGAVVLVPTGTDLQAAGVTALMTPRPRAAFAQLSRALVEPLGWTSAQTAIDPAARLGLGVRLAPGVVIGAGAVIDEGTVIGPGSVIGPGVQIGRRCEIGAHVSIGFSLIGDQVKIASGARIGEAGFGTVSGAEGQQDMPQFGRVIIQDHVSIGAGTCIDRGALDDTVIGERCKIDNLCQIGHNVVLGRNVVMAAFAGLSGSVIVGDGVMMGGRVGIADHVHIGAGAMLAADSAIMRDIPAGESWGGSPARPLRQWMRETAWLQRQVRPKQPGAGRNPPEEPGA